MALYFVGRQPWPALRSGSVATGQVRIPMLPRIVHTQLLTQKQSGLHGECPFRSAFRRPIRLLLYLQPATWRKLRGTDNSRLVARTNYTICAVMGKSQLPFLSLGRQQFEQLHQGITFQNRIYRCFAHKAIPRATTATAFCQDMSYTKSANGLHLAVSRYLQVS